MPTRFPLFFALIAIVLFSSAPLPAADWPHWLGPNGDNIAPADAFEADLNKWKIAWTTEVGLGFSSIAVAGKEGSEFVYTMGHDGKGKETVYCLNAATGAVVWTHAYDAPLMPNLHTGGPNATPTVIGNKVITLSKNGQIFCLSADKGAVLWKANLPELFAIKVPDWGFASSPIIDGNQVIFCGGKACAFDIESGKSLWVSKTAYLPAGYATAPVFDFNGNKFVAALDGKGFTILSAKDGTEITRYPFKALFDMNATTPVILQQGKRIFISCTVTSDMLEFDGQKLTRVWGSKDMRNLMNNCVIFDGAMYGIDGEQQQSTNKLVSLDVATGKENWSEAAIGYGTTIGIGKTLLVLTERGLLITVKADPAKYSEISRRQLLDHVCWTTPTFANGKIFLRNDQGHVTVLKP